MELTTLPMLIKGILRVLEPSEKCRRVTDHVAVKSSMRADFSHPISGNYFYSVVSNLFTD